MTSGYRKPQVGDLVLVRDFQLAKDKGRKLEARWGTPRLLERMSHSGVSGHVRQLHDPPGKTKRFHLDDFLLYVPRGNDHGLNTSGEVEVAVDGVEYVRGAMGVVQGLLRVGQRSFDLGDIGGSG